MKSLLIAILLLPTTLKGQQFEYHLDTANPKIGEYIIMWQVWGCNGPNMRPDMAKSLDDVFIKVIKQNPLLVFQIEEHSDCRGDSINNRRLTQRHADSMRAYIIYRGIEPGRILALGMGEDDLYIAKCNCGLADVRNKCLEAEHQRNGRYVLRVVSRKQ